MAQIPLGNFDQVQGPAPVQTGSPDLSGALASSRAGVELGMQVQQVGLQGMQQQVEKQKQESTALANAKAQNALDAHDLQVRAATADVAEQIQTKQIDYNDAPKVLADTVAKIDVPQIPGLEPAQQERYAGQVRNNVAGSGLMLDNVVKQAKRDDGMSQFQAAIDLNGKQAGLPGADIATLNAKLQEWKQTAATFGMPEATASKMIQDRIDANWTNQALQVFDAHKEDATALQTMQHALTDPKGYYLDKLDPEKRDALSAKVTNQLYLLDQKQQVADAKIEKVQDRVFVEIGEQDASGIPPTAAQVVNWSAKFPPGSPRYDEFKQYQADGQKIQSVLRMPINQQTEYVQHQQMLLEQNGGDAHARANQTRLTATVTANTKLLTEQPISYAEQRLGVSVPPLDLAAVTDPAGVGKVAAQLQDRAATVDALAKNNGIAISPNLLKPEEVKLLVGTLAPMDPAKKVHVLGELRKGLGQSSYFAVLQQIAPDSPVTARAGELDAMQRTFSPDTATVSGNVGETMLRGEALLNKTKADKAQDGKAPAYPMPDESKMRTAFNDAVGDTFGNNPTLAERRYQEFKAYYAGRTAQQGAASDQLDSKIATDGVTATLGKIVKVNGHSVQAPYGWDESRFNDEATIGARGAVSYLPPDKQSLVLSQAHYIQIDSPGVPDSGFYALAVGRNPLRDKAGHVLTFRLGAATAAALKAIKDRPVMAPSAYLSDPSK